MTSQPADTQMSHALTWLTAAWEALPEVATFDAESQWNSMVDWPRTIALENELQTLIAHHGLTPAQQERYDHLRALQAQNAPLLAQLLNA